MFLTNNSFSNILISENGNIPKYQTLGNQSEDIGKFLDSVCKFTDNTKYIMTRVSTEGLVVDTDPAKKGSKTITKVVNTSTKKGKKLQTTKTKNGNNKLKADDERRLEQYINISRCIPSIAGIHGIKTIDGFFKSGYWKEYLDIDQKLFEQNYNQIEEFKGIIDGLFRGNLSYTSEEHNQRIIEYFKFRS